MLFVGLRGEGEHARLVDLHARGPTAATTPLLALEGQPLPGPWTATLPPPGALGGLWKVRRGECGLHDGPFRTYGWRDDRRVLIDDGDRLIGFVAWLHRKPISRRASDLLAQAAPDLKRAVLAWAREGLHKTGRRWNLLFDADGQLANTTPGVQGWLTPREADALGAWIREVGRGEAPPEGRIHGLPAEALRLDGEPTRYLVQVTVPGRPRLDPFCCLTAMQRVVVEFASVGATAVEIGKHCDISPETVKRHLKQAYARLGVASRAEVARLRWEG